MKTYNDNQEFLKAQVREISLSVDSLDNDSIIEWVKNNALDFRINYYKGEDEN